MNIPVVKDLMATSLVTLRPSMSIYDAIELLLKNNISGACVVDDQKHLLGVLSEKDCLHIFASGALHQLPNAIVADYMSKEVTTVEPDAGLFTVAEMFLKNTFRRIPVVEGGKLMGQVSRRDVLQGSRKIWGESLHGEKPWTDAKYIPEQVKAALETKPRSTG
jgi:CBS domain-containing protein